MNGLYYQLFHKKRNKTDMTKKNHVVKQTSVQDACEHKMSREWEKCT